MSTSLYTLDILRLAAATAGFPRLSIPDTIAERRAMTCGSRIVVDLDLDALGEVTSIGLDVRACALGQAAATVFARHAIGRTARDLTDARDAFARWLADADAPIPDWPGVDVLAVARSYPARHAAMRLPFEAAADAAMKVAA